MPSRLRQGKCLPFAVVYWKIIFLKIQIACPVSFRLLLIEEGFSTAAFV
jgi:hypothetical protein